MISFITKNKTKCKLLTIYNIVHWITAIYKHPIFVSLVIIITLLATNYLIPTVRATLNTLYSLSSKNITK